MPLDEIIPAGPVVLRPLHEDDADAIVRACTDPEIVRFIPLVPLNYTRHDALTFLELAKESRKAGGAELAIGDRETGAWLGNIGIKPPSRYGGAEVGYMVAPWARGRGVATAALRALTARAFAAGLPRTELLIDVENAASQQVAMAAGYRREAVVREVAADRSGRRADMVLYSSLPGDTGEPARRYLPLFPGGELTDGVVRLAPLGLGDAVPYRELMSDPDVRSSLVAPDGPTAAEVERRCRHAVTEWLAGVRADIAIKDAATGEFAGDLQLAKVDPVLSEAMVGYSLAPGHRGKGFATRAVNLLAEWAFSHTPLVRLIAGTLPGNLASQRVLARAGFEREAVLRNGLPVRGGGREDNVLWARLRP
ncbi:GNAT family N-acetyltransferase [Sinosporangium siamense]|uniref:GNAT family N-acetyltransferase n=1 Tax=Sinosporangium siamense TaxID=1367973 RepID=UPI001EF30DFD|nr:GNAT family protein [Sinosporangium siamense]